MILNKIHLLTKLEIWYPKYGDTDGWEVWISQSPPLQRDNPIEFTKAKHLKGQRFYVRRDDVVRSPLGSNGQIAVYRVPFAMLESWETQQEAYDLAMAVFDH